MPSGWPAQAWCYRTAKRPAPPAFQEIGNATCDKCQVGGLIADWAFAWQIRTLDRFSVLLGLRYDSQPKGGFLLAWKEAFNRISNNELRSLGQRHARQLPSVVNDILCSSHYNCWFLAIKSVGNDSVSV